MAEENGRTRAQVTVNSRAPLAAGAESANGMIRPDSGQPVSDNGRLPQASAQPAFVSVDATSDAPHRPAAAGAPRRDYRRIDADAVYQTIVRLEERIGARFPNSSLRNVARDLVDVARDTAQTIANIQKRSSKIRIVSYGLAATILLILLVTLFTLKLGHVETLPEAIQVGEAALSASFFIGAAIIYLLSLESSVRRKRALEAIHELRALAHVVDMHQLTKDPALLLNPGPVTTPSPRPFYTAFELQRYLEYCSEMLALISKIAVLYVQDFPDTDAVGVVDEIEDLTAGLSRKIWEKVVLLDRHAPSNGQSSGVLADRFAAHHGTPAA